MNKFYYYFVLVSFLLLGVSCSKGEDTVLIDANIETEVIVEQAIPSGNTLLTKPSYIQLKLDIALCCNPWQTELPFEALPDLNEFTIQIEGIVDDFLTTENINSVATQVEQTGPGAVCVTCCECPSGFTAFVVVPHYKLRKMLSLGFEYP